MWSILSKGMWTRFDGGHRRGQWIGAQNQDSCFCLLRRLRSNGSMEFRGRCVVAEIENISAGYLEFVSLACSSVTYNLKCFGEK